MASKPQKMEPLSSEQSTRQHSFQRNPMFPTQSAFVYCCKKLKPMSPDLNMTEIYKPRLLRLFFIMPRWWLGGFLYNAAGVWVPTTGLMGKLTRDKDTWVLFPHLGLWIIPYFPGLQLPPTSQQLPFTENWASGRVLCTTGSWKCGLECGTPWSHPCS